VKKSFGGNVRRGQSLMPSGENLEADAVFCEADAFFLEAQAPSLEEANFSFKPAARLQDLTCRRYFLLRQQASEKGV